MRLNQVLCLCLGLFLCVCSSAEAMSSQAVEQPQFTDFHIIIPAHMNSERLPDKALLEIDGISMLQRTFEQAKKAKPLSVTIATDDERIRQAAIAFHANVIMTSSNPSNGTARVAEAVKKMALSPQTIVVNVPSDEPLIDPKSIQLAARSLVEHPQASVATLSAVIKDKATFEDSNIVKLVKDSQDYALYFSRAMIPFPQRAPVSLDNCQGHIGVYAYTVETLNAYEQAEKSMLEEVEKLEQLRFLVMGKKIYVATTHSDFMGVNTPKDLEQVRQTLSKSGNHAQ